MLDEAKQLLKRLPSNYTKDESSNLAKMLEIVGGQIKSVKDALALAMAYRDVDQATGRTLDNIGRNVKQPRGTVSDATYRALIKAKIARNLSRGDINTLKAIVATMLSTDAGEVSVKPLWETEPAAVQVSAPLAPLAQFELTPSGFAQIVQEIVAGGVRAATLLQGTFQFSSQPDAVEIDQDKGFAPLDQSTGGTLGAYYDTGDEQKLPI